MLSFICVGPQRTASSWLDQMLRQHPQISLPNSVKETFFWDQRYSKGFQWYYSHFKTTNHQIMGEIAPTCFDNPQACHRITDANPEIKVLICLRDPIERTYSLYCHKYATGRLKGNFAQALNEDQRLVNSSKYSQYVNLWSKNVGSENILLVRQEGVAQEPIAVLNDICAFIGIPAMEWENPSQKYGQKAQPISVSLTAMANQVARSLRAMGIHSLPELGKKMGLKKLIYQGGSSQYPPMLESDRLRLFEELKQEYEWLSQLPKNRTLILSKLSNY